MSPVLRLMPVHQSCLLKIGARFSRNANASATALAFAVNSGIRPMSLTRSIRQASSPQIFFARRIMSTI